MNNTESIFILYVSDQQRSRDFYEKVFSEKAILDVPGMTEFRISTTSRLGLMPEKGIVKILRDAVPDPATGNGIPRCEIYLYVDEPETFIQRSIQAGAKLVDAFQRRDWGDEAGYVADLDGNILVFARRIT